MAWRKKFCIRLDASFFLSTPALSSSSVLFSAMPSIQDVAKTLCAVCSQLTSGISNPTSPLMFSPNSEIEAASNLKSSSSFADLSKTPTMATGCKRLKSGKNLSPNLAATKKLSMSFLKRISIPGRSSFMAMVCLSPFSPIR